MNETLTVPVVNLLDSIIMHGFDALTIIQYCIAGNFRVVKNSLNGGFRE